MIPTRRKNCNTCKHLKEHERNFYESLSKDLACGKAFRFVTDKLEGKPT